MEIDLHPVRINHTFRIRFLVYTMCSEIASLFRKKAKKHRTRSSGKPPRRKNVFPFLRTVLLLCGHGAAAPGRGGGEGALEQAGKFSLVEDA